MPDDFIDSATAYESWNNFGLPLHYCHFYAEEEGVTGLTVSSCTACVG